VVPSLAMVLTTPSVAAEKRRSKVPVAGSNTPRLPTGTVRPAGLTTAEKSPATTTWPATERTLRTRPFVPQVRAE